MVDFNITNYKLYNNNPDKFSDNYTHCPKCYGCTMKLNSIDPAYLYQTLKIIQNTVRVPSSLYTMNLGALNVYQRPVQFGVNWNQMSDRAVRHVQPVTVSSRGSSTKHSITRHRPNAGTPGGAGVDIKHNSYYRYMDRLKAKKPIRRGVIPPTFGLPIPFNPAYPIYGGKTVKTSIVAGCNCPLNSAATAAGDKLINTIYGQPIVYQPNSPIITVGTRIYTNTTGGNGILAGTVLSINNGIYSVFLDNNSNVDLTIDQIFLQGGSENAASVVTIDDVLINGILVPNCTVFSAPSTCPYTCLDTNSNANLNASLIASLLQLNNT